LEAEQTGAMLKAAQQTAGLPIDHLAILTDPEAPPGEGELRVDPAAGRLVRSLGRRTPTLPWRIGENAQSAVRWASRR
jgi:hypothetical protein